jgi:hypothetical protein
MILSKLITRFITWLMKILPSEIVCIFNDVSLQELDKRGWIIWEEKNDNNRKI